MLSGSDHNEGSTVPEHANPASENWRFYRPELDVLRLLAFLLVFVHHAGLAIFGCLLLMRVWIGSATIFSSQFLSDY